MVKASTLLKTILVVAVVLALLGGTTWAIDEITNFSGVHISGSFGTATPALMINQPSGGAGNPFEVRAANTPVFSVNSAGDLTYSGTPVINGASYINAPTAVGTATPALFVNSLGVSNLFEVRDASTPVWAINNGGAVVAGGAGSYAGVQTFNSNVIVNAPTAVATAVPAFSVNSLGVSTLFEVRDAATPVFTVLDGGNVTGKVLRYASTGVQIICGSATVTDTATIASGLTVVTYCWSDLNQAIAGDAAKTNCRPSSGNVVVDVKNSAVTPAANGTGAAIFWCAIGTP